MASAEAIGMDALGERISWREAGRRADCLGRSLQTHMEKHYIAAALAEHQDEMDRLIAEAKAGLLEQFAIAPPDVKPLVLVALQNLEGLRAMKPSQEHLIKALKTIQEMTGMKNEQRLMLGFAEAMFGRKAIPVASTSKKVGALPQGESD
jgi:hypothetical protein